MHSWNTQLKSVSEILPFWKRVWALSSSRFNSSRVELQNRMFKKSCILRFWGVSWNWWGLHIIKSIRKKVALWQSDKLSKTLSHGPTDHYTKTWYYFSSYYYFMIFQDIRSILEGLRDSTWLRHGPTWKHLLVSTATIWIDHPWLLSASVVIRLVRFIAVDRCEIGQAAKISESEENTSMASICFCFWFVQHFLSTMRFEGYS